MNLKRQIEAEVGELVKRRPVSTSEALTVTCPLCKAEPSRDCVFMWPHNFRANTYSPKGKKMVARVGQRMARPHHERRRAYGQQSRKDQAQEQVRMLQEWLTEYGDIFREA
jgi:hypothetical protein